MAALGEGKDGAAETAARLSCRIVRFVTPDGSAIFSFANWLLSRNS